MRRVEKVESVEDFATLSAYLSDPFSDRAALLAAASLDEAAFEELRQGYTERLSKAANSPQKQELCARFRAAFEAARRQRVEPPPPAKTDSVPPPLAAPPAAPPLGTDSPREPAHTPSYLRQDAPAMRGMPSHMMGAPLRSASPMPSAAVSGHAPVAPEAFVAPPPRVIAHPPPAAPAAAQPPSTPPAVAPPPLISIGAVPVAPLIQIGAPSPAASPSARLQGTALLDGPLPGVREAMSLPFKEGAAPIKPAPSPKPVKSISTGTSMSAEGMPIHSLPFKGGAARPEGNLTGWTVERYAELCIDLSMSGRPRPEVLGGYGLDEARFKSLDGYWEATIASDVRLQKTWADACTRRRAAFAKR
ncbi:MAG: hypothetical protein U0414_05130 [Polyangiaceae bacterium]